MKRIIFSMYSLFFALFCCCFWSCNTTKTNDNETAQQVYQQQKLAVEKPWLHVSADEFKGMSGEEQWKHISPVRRNYIRHKYFNEGKDLPADLKAIVEGDPEMETGPPAKAKGELATTGQKEPKQASGKRVENMLNLPVEEQWGMFSDKRKAYMKAHPEHYPDFKELLEKY